MVIYIVGNDRLTLCEVQIFTDGNRSVSFNFNILDSVLNHHLSIETISEPCIFFTETQNGNLAIFKDAYQSSTYTSYTADR